MTETWGPWHDIARWLGDTRRCPDCGTGLDRPVCRTCGLDLSVERAHDVRRLSFEAADALRRRAQVLAEMRRAQAAARIEHGPPGPRFPAADPRVPAVPPVAATATRGLRDAAPVPAPPSAARRVADSPTSTGPERSRPVRRRDISLQPILAGAGATLLAVAAVVFVFFTFGDDLALRAVVTGIVTVAAATVAGLLRRGGLRTTSEAVAALAAVLCWVDAELAMQAGLLGGLHPALARAVVLAVLAPVLVAVGHRLRVRTWMSAGLAAALAVPPSAAAGLPDPVWSSWWWVAAWALVALVAWTAMRTLELLAPRLGDGVSFTAESRALRAVRAAGLPAAFLTSVTASAGPAETSLASGWGATAVLWSAVLVVALVGGLVLRVRSWVTVGVLGTPLLPPLVTAAIPVSDWTAWWWTCTGVVVALTAFVVVRGLPVAARRLGDRLGRPLTLEARTLRLLRGLGFPLALLASCLAGDAPPLDGWWSTAVLWSAVVVAGLGGGYALRVRSWVSTALLAAPALPFLAAGGMPPGAWSAWWWASAGVMAAFVALAAVRSLPAVSRRLGDRPQNLFTWEPDVLLVVRGAGFPVALVVSCFAAELPMLSTVGATTVLWCSVTAVALVAGVLLRVRPWVSTGLVAVLPAPILGELAFLGDVPGLSWRWIGVFLLMALLAWAGGRAVGPVAARLGAGDAATTFRAELLLLRLVRGAAVPAALVAATVLPLTEVSGPSSAEAFAGNVPARSALLWAAVLLFAAVAGHGLRVRAWLSATVLAAPLLPLWVGWAVSTHLGSSWPVPLACLVAAVMTVLPRVADVVSGPRLGARFARERSVLDVAAAFAVAGAVVTSFDVPQPNLLPGQGGTAVLVALAALAVAVLRHRTHHRAWLFTGGVLAVASGALLGWVPGNAAVGWVPVGAAGAWIMLAVLTAPRVLRSIRPGSAGPVLASRSRGDLLRSGWAAVAATAVPAAIFVLGRVLDVWGAVVSASRSSWHPPVTVLGGPVFDAGPTAGAYATLPAWAGLGMAAVALTTLVAARLAPGDGVAPPERSSAPVLTLLATVGLVLHPSLPAVATPALLAVLGAVLVAAVARRSSTWSGLLPAVDAVRAAGRASARPAEYLSVIGGRPVTAAELRLGSRVALTGAVVVIVLVGAFSWISRPTAAVGALAVSGLVLALRAALPRPAHPWLVGAGYLYPLVVLGVVLAWLDLPLVAAVCAVSAAASLVTIVVTLGSRTSRHEWYAVLGVTAVPFVVGVITVVFERTWWSAGAAATMLALELVLLLTTRVGLPALVRAGAAFLLLPTASVMITSTGAMLFEVSGSPYVLPTAATFVAAVAAGAARIAERIGLRVPEAHGPGGSRLAGTVRGMLERSALLTGSIVILLAYLRPAAGPDIAVAVLLILAAGAALVAREPGRERVRLLAGALLLAALWTALASNGVRLVEAYTFAPAVGAGVTGVLAAWRLRRDGTASVSPMAPAVRNAWALAGAGLALAVVPSFVVYLTRPDAGDWRAFALLGAALAALGVAHLAGRRPWARTARPGLAGAAAFASLAGVLESWRWAPMPGVWPGDRGVRGSSPGAGPASSTGDRIGDPVAGIPLAADPTFAVGLAWAAVAVAVLVLSVPVARRAAGPQLRGLLRRHGFVPALVLGTASALAHMEPAWGAVVTLLVLEVVLLAALVLGVRRLVAGRAMGAAPWLVWVCAALLGIAAWSPRELRVEVFSVPLGVALVLAGWLALRDGLRRERAVTEGPSGRPAGEFSPPSARAVPSAGIAVWPAGFTGSWRTLSLGVLALVGPSVLSTATDPLTVRACGVVFVALMAVLAGSRLRLSAPFWLGVVTLGVEVVVVFAKLGVGVSPLPWILTLVPAAIVLLIIATLDERRTAASGGTAAYLRDLR
ncbi:SCO7613 C-terminal domain-containing membrane protein [Myceligenerans salitolerans]|uniref:Integral membrane protein n=1 Tax=Myceligenerans salitolerans TaxID=1230528 RepID=A0ABS3IBG3_9MICO|nr:hypothetical protein [Myceligenerans salitolerans]MBO0609719.1 hypothetical protein [Myceligenerans salitolerans]